jgi:hypothetical protein
VLDEFYRVAFREKIYRTIDELQADLDAWLVEYNQRRSHQSRWCFGKTPMQTFLDAIPLWPTGRCVLLPSRIRPSRKIDCVIAVRCRRQRIVIMNHHNALSSRVEYDGGQHDLGARRRRDCLINR